MSSGENPRGGENRGSAIVIVVVVQGTSYRYPSKTDGKVFSNFPGKWSMDNAINCWPFSSKV